MKPAARSQQRADPAFVASQQGDEQTFDHGFSNTGTNIGWRVGWAGSVPDPAGVERQFAVRPWVNLERLVCDEVAAGAGAGYNSALSRHKGTNIKDSCSWQ